MEAIELLKNYKKQFDPILEKYFSGKIKEAGRSHKLAKEAVKMIADFTTAGGKRIRPAILYYAYLAQGKRSEEKVIKVSMSVELTHSFLLIHDDIIDKDEKRHGTSTLHERYKKIGKRIAPQKDNIHFGNSMAMLAGDMASAMANEIIFTSHFSPEVIIKALDKLQKIVYAIVPGEMLDVVMEARGKTTEKEILSMYEGKTSSYSFEGPLHLGTILAGVDSDEILKKYSRYAMPLGVAFQIRDDILGIFGNEKKIGKPVGSDVIEGKQTLLLLKAKEMADSGQKKVLNDCLGKKDLKKSELEEFRRVIKETGSLEYCQKLSEKMVAESLQALEEIDIKNEEAKVFFKGLAEYMIRREK